MAGLSVPGWLSAWFRVDASRSLRPHWLSFIKESLSGRDYTMSRRLVLATAIAAALAADVGAVWGLSPVSKTITQVLREPLPPEDLGCSVEASRIVVQGPTFRYSVDKATGAIVGLEAVRQGQVVATLREPADLWIDDLRLTTGSGGTTKILAQGKDKVILVTEGALGANVAYSLQNTFYNDGVVVARFKLKPKKDLAIQRAITYQVSATGHFSQYLHKRRDTNGTDCFKGALPEAGRTAGLATLTSCLEVFSPDAALAVFTDRGGLHRSPADIETASLRVDEKKGDRASVVLTQHLVHIGPGRPAYTLRSGEEFSFRVGLAVAPNRLPHPRWRDLRMFIWVGDQKHPYPTDAEILTAARLGFTLFQMHRLGPPGEPRPPAGELDRVLKTVHDAGMLFLWPAGADLMYATAKGVTDLQAAGKWPLWQGFNYGGRYKARMDPYCDLLATCLASPNGLADYRIQCKTRMLERYPIDGMYIDDNLPYANCTLWKEHGHPQKTYDCLIELHDVNWRRRQALLSKCPHAVLIDHCSMGIILPAISAFDGHLFGEGYGFPSIEAYWNAYGSFKNMPAQGYLFAGDSETTRCGAEIAYAFDLLTGGGQYCWLDWRLWPKKFPYAAGVTPAEALFVKTYNLAQYYFGMYESEPYTFAQSKEVFTTTAPGTYATVYRNRVWNEVLVALANMGKKAAKTSLIFHQSEKLSLAADRRYAVYDVNLRTVEIARGSEALKRFSDLALAPHQLKLLYVREAPEGAVYHQWGGKRISENWDGAARRLSLRLYGPVGLEDSVFLGTGGKGIEQVTVNGKRSEFFADPVNKVIHGKVTFGREPIALEATCTADGACRLPNRSVTPDELTTEYFAKPRLAP